MNKIKLSIGIVLCGFIVQQAIGGPVKHPKDTLSKGVFILHKFQQAIGKELYAYYKNGDTTILTSDFKFTDRGREVPLLTTIKLNEKGLPVAFHIKGNTSRSSVIDSEVKIQGDSSWVRVNDVKHMSKILSPSFVIGGYAPVAVQMALIKFWNQTGKPKLIHTLPAGEIRIQRDGVDTISVSGKKEVLERYFVKGLIWGSELVWTTPTGDLVALFTNDAEGDKFEAIREDHVSTLPELIGKAGRYGMKNLDSGIPVQRDNVLVLKGGTVIDVVTGKLLSNTTVILRNGKIEKMGNGLKAPKEAKVVDVTGKFLMPGLWDMHAHFQQVEWGPAYLAAGVTTVRDCGNEFDFINAVKEAIDSKTGVGPHIIKAGIVDGTGPYALGIVRVDSKDDTHREVLRYKNNGYEQIKIYSSIKPEMIKAIAEEAHAVGLTVTGHVPRGVTAQQAVMLGQDQINHFTSIYSSLFTGPDRTHLNLEDSLPKAVLATLKDYHTVVDPTLGIYEWITRSLDKPVDSFEPGVNFVTEDLKEIFRNTGMSSEDAKTRSNLLTDGKKLVLTMYKMGIPIVAGTDMMVPGYSLFREIELYHEAGLTALEAIQTATVVPARVMKKESESGSIAEGKTADIIILDANPLENISSIRTVKRVIKNGWIYNCSDLRKAIDFKE